MLTKLQDIIRVEPCVGGYKVLRVERTCDSRGEIVGINRSVLSRHETKGAAETECRRVIAAER